MISTKNLTYHYQKDKTFHFPDIKINSNESLLILGKSGIGKTTLLHLLGGLMKPVSGAITIGTTDITILKESALDRFRGDNISIIFQQHHFVESLNVWENIKLASDLIGLEFDTKNTKENLQRLNIDHLSNKYTNQLSQGEKQRVAIARSLVNRPQVILADEPTSALDDANTQEVAKLLTQQAKQVGASLLIVTHDYRLQNTFSQSLILS